MSTSKETVAHILDQLEPLPVRARAMFGGYGLYCDEKIVALIGDDTLFVKPTAIATNFLNETHLKPPYAGAKDYYAVPGDRLEDRDWLQAFIAQSAELLPLPQQRAKKTARPKP